MMKNYKNYKFLQDTLLNVKGAMIIQSFELNNILLFLTSICVKIKPFLRLVSDFKGNIGCILTYAFNK